MRERERGRGRGREKEREKGEGEGEGEREREREREKKRETETKRETGRDLKPFLETTSDPPIPSHLVPELLCQHFHHPQNEPVLAPKTVTQHQHPSPITHHTHTHTHQDNYHSNQKCGKLHICTWVLTISPAHKSHTSIPPYSKTKLENTNKMQLGEQFQHP